ncbi:O-acetyltransferase (homolog to galactoside O-acetyltransferase) (plasmid) [Natronomonas pharaonis DSM 2160]|uniref:O-acetyltransferase (Homolog to galactoside O-acetyltransferase) n=1 Tax=Natronomonas pharaonis (strain ATCC 35678 / DSM 2160 / CIP 103997 / JCM 8858 / NBRC 14720 / NCIMB 2260 / Gabara) TaxID=348780 RepID=Q3ILX2_NATPD|nr:acyltransferase [Natronomonas pharaonis]CAI50898.1 O-acetyltransferase (homolog to galactoside O-acetyltransferase) [Natronomonas pharaonis DSM 2160]
MTKRHVEVPVETQAAIDETIDYVDMRLSEDDTADAVAEILADLFGDSDVYEQYRAGESLPPMTRLRVRSYDPRNVLIETEHWAEQELSALQESKCLRYLWEGFDLSPLSNNLAFALPFRQTLADHLFAEAGDGLRLFSGIKIQCGHNIEMGDNVVVHNDVLLDDRGRLQIGDRVSVADRSHIHTHAHDTVDQSDVTNYETILDDDVRLGYGSMISAGCRIGENAMVGSGATTLGDVPPHHIAAGSPAKSVKIKPGWEAIADDPGPLVDNRERRQLPSDVPDSVDEFDEFNRNLSPPSES